MNYDVLYSNNQKQFNNPVIRGKITNMGNWRSRWERKRDLDKSKGFYINRICTKPTDKDYIVTSVYGFNKKNNMFFKIVPSASLPKPKDNNWRTNPKFRCNDKNSTRFGKFCKFKYNNK